VKCAVVVQLAMLPAHLHNLGRSRSIAPHLRHKSGARTKKSAPEGALLVLMLECSDA